MKHASLFSAFLCLAITTALRAQTLVFAASGLTSSSQIAMPTAMTTLLKAVNVGSTSANTVNGITFAADTGNWAAANTRSTFVGNGYTANGQTETSGGISGATFSTTTINILGATGGGYFTGTTFAGLSPNTNYVFQLFLSDQNTGRGAQFSYTLGSTTNTQNIVQSYGAVNLFQVSFNSGSSTTFDWGLNPITGYHDAKVSGFAFYSDASAIPEPSTYAIMAGVLSLGFAAWRRSRRAAARAG